MSSTPSRTGRGTAGRPLVRLHGIVKQFPGFLALDQVNLELYPGEIHALTGENGSGKSTLAKIIYGAHQPDSGTIEVDGEPTAIRSSSRALELGIVAISQTMGRFVDDIALLLEVMEGPDGVDPFAVPAPRGDHRQVRLAGLRVAFYDGDGSVPVTDGTRRAVKMAAEALADAGATVVEIDPPEFFGAATEVFFGALAADGGAT